MFFAPAIRRQSALSPIAPDLGFERVMGDMLRKFDGFGIQEDDKSWTLSFDVPGVAKEHLNVSVSGNKVLVETTGESARQYKFSYELPSDVDADETQAHVADGVLTLRLGKAEAKTRRRIEIS